MKPNEIVSLIDLLSLVMKIPPSYNTVWKWTDQQKKEAAEWASNTYLRASDNPLRKIKKPKFLTSA